MTIVAEEPKGLNPHLVQADPNSAIGVFHQTLLASMRVHHEMFGLSDADAIVAISSVLGTMKYYTEQVGVTEEEFEDLVFKNIDTAYDSAVTAAKQAARNDPANKVTRKNRRKNTPAPAKTTSRKRGGKV